MYSIPDRLSNVVKVKQEIKQVLDSTGQDTNITFRQYPDLIRNIPNLGVMTPEDIDELVEKSILINGENA